MISQTIEIFHGSQIEFSQFHESNVTYFTFDPKYAATYGPYLARCSIDLGVILGNPSRFSMHREGANNEICLKIRDIQPSDISIEGWNDLDSIEEYEIEIPTELMVWVFP